MSKVWGIFFNSILLMMVANCSVTQSDNVKTSGIFAVYSVKDDGTGPRADATFYVGGTTGTVLELSQNDRVEINGRLMRKNKNMFGKIHYTGEASANTTFTFRFSRQTEDGEEIYYADVNLPEPISIQSPFNGDRFFRGQSLPVSWRPATGRDSVSITLSGQGQSSHSNSTATFVRTTAALNDSGRFVIPAAETDPDSIVGAITNGTITVERVRRGTMDRGLDGTITASSEDRVTNLTFN